MWQALREVLTLDPQHAEAQRNLAVLLRERQRPAADTVFAGEQLGGECLPSRRGAAGHLDELERGPLLRPTHVDGLSRHDPPALRGVELAFMRHLHQE